MFLHASLGFFMVSSRKSQGTKVLSYACEQKAQLSTGGLRACCLHGNTFISASTDRAAIVWSTGRPAGRSTQMMSSATKAGDGACWKQRFPLRGHLKPISQICAKGFLAITSEGHGTFRAFSLKDGVELFQTKPDLQGATFTVMAFGSGYELLAPLRAKKVGVWPLADYAELVGRGEACTGHRQLKLNPQEEFGAVHNPSLLVASEEYLLLGTERQTFCYVTEPGRRRAESEALGVSLGFLFHDFPRFASRVSSSPDPTFRDLQEAIWTGSSPQPFQGSDTMNCPP